MLSAFSARFARLLRRLEPRQDLTFRIGSASPLFDIIPAASSRPAPSAPPSPSDGIPSADAPPPASAETLSGSVRTRDQRFIDFVDEIERQMGGSLRTRPVRFVRLKVWAVRLGILALVGVGFGTFALVVTRSLAGLAIGAAIGVALALKRAMRISDEDIDF